MGNDNNQKNTEEDISINESENLNKIEVEDKEEIKEVENFQDKYLRALAEMENTRRRFEKDLISTKDYAIANFAKELISIMDIFNKAFTFINIDKIEDKEFKNFALGIDYTKKQMEQTFAKFNIKKIVINKGDSFNPNFHETLSFKEDKEAKENTIAEVLEDGYSIGERLLRPAKVVIIKNNLQ